MPVSAFYQLFQSLGENEQLSVKLLRMKTVTLLALFLMTRPSDRAPKAKIFDPQSMSSKAWTIFSSMKTVRSLLHSGHKNDTNRQGFEISIPTSSDKVMWTLCVV